MDIQKIIEAFVQFLTDFFTALGKFLGVEQPVEEIGDDEQVQDGE